MTYLPDNIIDLSDYTETISFLVYGEPGCGKTVLGGTAPNALIIATENGTVSAARQGSKAKVVNCVHDFDQVMATYEWLYEHCEDEDFPFDWVVIDTGTEMQNEILRWIVKRRVADGIAKSLNPYKTELQEYGEMHAVWRDYVGKFNDLPVNILWLAHTMQVEDQDGNDILLPAFSGLDKKGYQIARWTASQMHAYGHMRVAKTKDADGHISWRRSIQWQPDDKVRAKDRFDVLGRKTWDKTIPQLQKIIEDSASVEEPAPKKKAAAPAAS